MSTRPAIIALLVTLLLAIGAYLVLKPPGGGTSTSYAVLEGERVLSLDPAALRGITLHNPPAQPQIIERTADGGWQWRSSAQSNRTYALEDGAMRTILRKFAEAKGLAKPGDTSPLSDNPAPVTLTFKTEAGDTVLRLSPRALGGQVLAEVTTPATSTTPKATRAAIVADELLNVLTSPGPSAWRDTRALSADPVAASRITFTDGAGANGFGLARRDGQWIVTPPAPVTAPADAEAVNAVIRTLESLTISRFFDDATQPTTQAAGLATTETQKPSAILTLEFDDRSIDPKTQQPVVSTRTARLIIGQPADSAGTTLYATPDDGRTIFGIDALPLTKLTTPASNLVMRNATRTPAADVGTIEITSATGKGSVKLTRDGVTGRWTETREKAEPVTLDPAQAVATETILTFVTRAAADTVTFQPPENATPRATIALLSPSGNPLDRFDVLTLPGPAGSAVVLRNVGDPVCRAYSKPPDELTRWLIVLER